jgi:hypothetical protein
MGKVILRDADITINSIDLSDHISKVTIATTFNLVDVTAFGARYKEILQGLGDATVVCDFFQDFDAASVDSVLWPLSQSGSVFPVVVKPTSATVSSTNPSYTMQAILGNYDPLDGSVGAASITSVTFANASQSGVVRGTA